MHLLDGLDDPVRSLAPSVRLDVLGKGFRGVGILLRVIVGLPEGLPAAPATTRLALCVLGKAGTSINVGLAVAPVARKAVAALLLTSLLENPIIIGLQPALVACASPSAIVTLVSSNCFHFCLRQKTYYHGTA